MRLFSARVKTSPYSIRVVLDTIFKQFSRAYNCSASEPMPKCLGIQSLLLKYQKHIQCVQHITYEKENSWGNNWGNNWGTQFEWFGGKIELLSKAMPECF